MRKILLTILVGLTAAPALADNVPQQRIVRWPAAAGDKGYRVLRYNLINTTVEPTKVWPAPFVPLKVVGGARIRYKAKLRPNHLDMVYQWQQDNSPRIRQIIWSNQKGGAFRWTIFKRQPSAEGSGETLQGDADDIVVCQQGPKPADARFCLNPPDADTFDCDSFDTACLGDGTEVLTIEDFAGSLEGAFDVDQEIPAVSAWGLFVMVLLMLTAGTLVIARWRATTTLPQVRT